MNFCKIMRYLLCNSKFFGFYQCCMYVTTFLIMTNFGFISFKVKSYWLNSDGRDVIFHMIDNFLL